MHDDLWQAVTWEGNRALQEREFAALPFRDKILRLEEMQRVSAALQAAKAVEIPGHDGE